jgi:hypothetical protein
MMYGDGATGVQLSCFFKYNPDIDEKPVFLLKLPV